MRTIDLSCVDKQNRPQDEQNEEKREVVTSSTIRCVRIVADLVAKESPLRKLPSKKTNELICIKPNKIQVGVCYIMLIFRSKRHIVQPICVDLPPKPPQTTYPFRPPTHRPLLLWRVHLSHRTWCLSFAF
ncbi:MAG: hypothetical protein CL920_20790 [Deltaproteobacteria bacterium]|nr:hypothetical protein [Deltaproteobacteria bacterium]MBU51132.1 hypothetical protein [Deltaproteobacteria bacterium]